MAGHFAGRALSIDVGPRYVPTWAPFCQFRRNAEEARIAVEAMYNVPYEAVKARLVRVGHGKAGRSFADPAQDKGNAASSLTARLIESQRSLGCFDTAMESDIKGVAGTLYTAAQDTVRHPPFRDPQRFHSAQTSCVLATFILAMVMNPAVQTKVQQEIDHVVVGGRWPNFEDRESMPYLENVIKEVLRCVKLLYSSTSCMPMSLNAGGIHLRLWDCHIASWRTTCSTTSFSKKGPRFSSMFCEHVSSSACDMNLVTSQTRLAQS